MIAIVIKGNYYIRRVMIIWIVWIIYIGNSQEENVKMKRNVLVTGGTIFVSRTMAQYFRDKGDQVYVLNRNTHAQPEGVILIEADRNEIGDKLRGYNFDAIIDVNAYTEEDVEDLLDAVDQVNDYVLISSSAVYPETNEQPFSEEQITGPNSIWGDYGTNKIAAEKLLSERVPDAYIIRPPYLCGAGNNLRREAFVFQCAMMDRPFYVPGNGEMKLQFFDVADLAKFIDLLLIKKPENKVFNVGNKVGISVNDWVKICYGLLGKEPEIRNVDNSHYIRNYFPFNDYEYILDTAKQESVMKELKPLKKSMEESFEWYKSNSEKVVKKEYIKYIDEEIER